MYQSLSWIYFKALLNGNVLEPGAILSNPKFFDVHKRCVSNTKLPPIEDGGQTPSNKSITRSNVTSPNNRNTNMSISYKHLLPGSKPTNHERISRIPSATSSKSKNLKNDNNRLPNLSDSKLSMAYAEAKTLFHIPEIPSSIFIKKNQNSLMENSQMFRRKSSINNKSINLNILYDEKYKDDDEEEIPQKI